MLESVSCLHDREIVYVSLVRIHQAHRDIDEHYADAGDLDYQIIRKYSIIERLITVID